MQRAGSSCWLITAPCPCGDIEMRKGTANCKIRQEATATQKFWHDLFIEQLRWCYLGIDYTLMQTANISCRVPVIIIVCPRLGALRRALGLLPFLAAAGRWASPPSTSKDGHPSQAETGRELNFCPVGWVTCTGCSAGFTVFSDIHNV